MDYPLKVFLDTNVFDSQYYNFNESNLLRLKKLTKEGKISLFLSNIVIGEAKRHIIRNVTDARNAFKKSYDKELLKQGYESWNTGEQAVRILKPLEKYSFLYMIFDKSLKSNMISDAIAQFELYIAETKATIIDSSGIDVNNIVSDFFEEQPPFEAKKEKKNEFPDAFLMAKIKLFAKQHGEIYVISDDDAFKSLGNDSTINVFDTLHSFFVFINPNEDWIKPVQLYIDENRRADKIKCLIENKIFDNNPHVDGLDHDRKGIVDGFDYDETEIIKISNIDFNFQSVDFIAKDSLMVTLSCKANIIVECTFFDESNSIWDSEEKEYSYRSYGQVKEAHSVEFDGILKLNVDDEKIIDIDSVQFEFTLDQYTRISQDVVENNSNDFLNNDYYRDQYNEDYGGTYGIMHDDNESYIEDIKNDKLIDEIFEKISKFAEMYKSFIEERYENWELIVEEISVIDSEENDDVLSEIFKSIFDVNISEDNNFELIHKMITEKLSQIINTYSEFQIDFNEDWKYSSDSDDWLVELKYKDNIFSLKSEIDIGSENGMFYIEHNSKEIEKVDFNICLPDFEITDYGGVKPSSEFSIDLYDVAMDELIDKFNKFFEKIKLYYEKLDGLYERLSNLIYEQ